MENSIREVRAFSLPRWLSLSKQGGWWGRNLTSLSQNESGFSPVMVRDVMVANPASQRTTINVRF